MIYFQVEDVNAKFLELVDLEAKNWILEQKPKPKVAAPTKKAIASKPFKPKAKASSNIKAMMAAKRKAAMTVNKENENANIQIPEIQITKNEEEIPKKQVICTNFKSGNERFIYKPTGPFDVNSSKIKKLCIFQNFINKALKL